MANILRPPYLLNTVFYDIVKNNFDTYAGPSFRNQKQLAERIIADKKLVMEIIKLNPYSKSVSKKTIKGLQNFC